MRWFKLWRPWRGEDELHVAVDCKKTCRAKMIGCKSALCPQLLSKPCNLMALDAFCYLLSERLMRLLTAARVLAVLLVLVCILIPDRLGRVGFGLAVAFGIGVGWASFLDGLRRFRDKPRSDN